MATVFSDPSAAHSVRFRPQKPEKMRRGAANPTDAAICIFLALSKTFTDVCQSIFSPGDRHEKRRNHKHERWQCEWWSEGRGRFGSVRAAQPALLSVRFCRKSR